MNNVNMIGYVGRNPEVRTTQSGKSVCGFSLAVKRGEKTIWVNIIAWGPTAELVGKYVHTGDLIGVTGSIDSRTYEKNGEKRTTFEIVADRIHFCRSKTSEKIQTYQEVPDSELPFDNSGGDGDLPF